MSAHITKMKNLSVRWHPAGWHNTEIDWNSPYHTYGNLIAHRRWRQPPDFRWFSGDEDPTFDSRPSNELMYLRGVGSLRPEPRESYGSYSKFNSDVVDSILICAVRAAYEGLIEQLERNFDVTAIDEFDFTVEEKIDQSDTSRYLSSIRRVVSWSLDDAVELRERRARSVEEEREKRDRAEFAAVEVTFGFSLNELIAALLRAYSKKSSGSSPSMESVNRNAAKELRNAGSSISAGGVRRVRELIERYEPALMPVSLREHVEVIQPTPPDNVVPLRTRDD
ncbi:hypothetical protein [Ancylobacter sp. TS-1]|uniref:hypothetical protein n=1 Tax=Ancylobacter sp. TS-1 TaxID=1850374 RepID=UPI001265B93D|nr:hypothetical protein [Ancylobacter sp. TS-1]QFR34712.1 hypothetical protein GBB76_17270 [Ancylobacter sp. TS-1]